MANIPIQAGEEEIVFQGKIVEVVQTPMKIGDKVINFEMARRSPGTRLLIVDLKKKQILLTKEYRSELQNYDYRLPGGKVFDKLTQYNEFLKSGDKGMLSQAENRAKIEAREEAGIDTKSITHVHTSKNGATMEWDLYYFVIDGWEQTEQSLELGEDIEISWQDFDSAKELALDGKMKEDRSVAVLLKWLYNYEKNNS